MKRHIGRGHPSKNPRPLIRPVRWSEDEWELVLDMADDLEITPSELIRGRTLGTLETGEPQDP